MKKLMFRKVKNMDEHETLLRLQYMYDSNNPFMAGRRKEVEIAMKAIKTVEKIKDILNKRDNAFDGQEFGASYSDLDNIIEEIREVINN